MQVPEAIQPGESRFDGLGGGVVGPRPHDGPRAGLRQERHGVGELVQRPELAPVVEVQRLGKAPARLLHHGEEGFVDVLLAHALALGEEHRVQEQAEGSPRPGSRWRAGKTMEPSGRVTATSSGFTSATTIAMGAKCDQSRRTRGLASSQALRSFR